jgi:hypothetical protein
VKSWEIIADNLSKARWSLGWVSAMNSQGPTGLFGEDSETIGNGFKASGVEPVFSTKDDAINYAQTVNGNSDFLVDDSLFHKVRNEKRPL